MKTFSLILFLIVNFFLKGVLFSQVENLSDNTFYIDSNFTILCNGYFNWKYDNGQIVKKQIM